jgi:hypothetical protein
MTARKAGIRLQLDGGGDLADKINPRFVSLSLTEKREAEADELELTLQNTDGLLALPEPGAVLLLALGWEAGEGLPTGLVDKGRFTVDEVEASGPPDMVRIRARSADMTGSLRQRRTVSYVDMTLGQILDLVAQRHGREARVDPALRGQATGPIEQEGKSDLAFVADLGRRFDAIATWKDGKLLFLPIGQSATAGGTPLDQFQLRREDGWTWRWAQADRDDYDGASAQWQDMDAGQRKTVKIGGDNRLKLKRVYATEGEARQAAQAALSRAKRKPYSFSYDLAIANPALQVDGRIALAGWNDKIDGASWLLESIRTDMDANGLRQSIEMESV